MKYSITYSGIIIAVAGTFLMNYGFSEVCASEISNNIPVVIGGIIAAWGRFRLGGVNALGVKKA